MTDKFEPSFDALCGAHQTHAEILAGAISMLSRMFGIRDPHTDGHQKRVSQLAVSIAHEMGLDGVTMKGIKFGALVHDVGKIGVPSELLTTSRRLSGHEMAIIRTHPVIGRDILSGIKFPWSITDIVVQHHERMDGSGYPAGLRGEEIIMEARIVAVADVVEAMTYHRPYRAGLGIHAAMEEIRQNRGVLYDRQAVDACLCVIERTNGRFWAPEKRSELLATG